MMIEYKPTFHTDAETAMLDIPDILFITDSLISLHATVQFHDTIRYDTRCYINVRSKANMSQLNLPHATDN